MMRDFTITQYTSLLDQLKKSGGVFQTVREYATHPEKNAILLRHDIDDRKAHALIFAKLQFERGIKGTYYFRVVPESFQEELIQEIESLGHEIGYHYEDMDFAKGNTQEAYRLFIAHLEKLRGIAKIDTICMHGSPRSEYDNKDVWKEYSYKQHGIIAEPYLDFNFDDLYYLTDTGRMWDGKKFSIRDEIKTTKIWPQFHSTQDIVLGLQNKKLPFPVMINFHPQRWTDELALWIKEMLFQSAKNQIKKWRKQRLK
jgi:hypothetical protein